MRLQVFVNMDDQDPLTRQMYNVHEEGRKKVKEAREMHKSQLSYYTLHLISLRRLLLLLYLS